MSIVRIFNSDKSQNMPNKSTITANVGNPLLLYILSIALIYVYIIFKFNGEKA